MTPINACSDSLQALQNTCDTFLAFPATGSDKEALPTMILRAQQQAIASGTFTITSPSMSTDAEKQAVQTVVPNLLKKLTDTCSLAAASPVTFPQPCQPHEDGCDGSGIDGCSG